MIMSPVTKVVEPFAVLHHPSSTKSSAFGCGSSALTMPPKTTVKIPASICRLPAGPSATADAIRELDQKLSNIKASSSPPPASTSRALQPLDTNLSKADWQQAISSRPTVSASASKLSASCSSPTKKVRSPSSKDIVAGSRSVAKANKIGSLLGHAASVTLHGERISVKVPQKLPTPRLKPNSSPYQDLVAHLSRHHFFAEAHEVERSSITPDFYLTQYLESARLGKCSLYHQTLNFLDANRDIIMARVVPGQQLPEHVPLDVTAWINTLQRPPTHLLAVHSDSEAATLYAVHGPVMALQCVSIPFLPASNETRQHGKTIKTMATLALRVPSLQHFNTVLRWLYSQSTTSLLHELLPLSHILAHLARRALASKTHDRPKLEAEAEREEADVAHLSTADLVEAMATLSTKHFLERLQAIQAVWKNGVALGIVSWSFWATLDNAWTLLVAAMAAGKRRSQLKLVSATANELTAQLRSTRIE